MRNAENKVDLVDLGRCLTVKAHLRRGYARAIPHFHQRACDCTIGDARSNGDNTTTWWLRGACLQRIARSRSANKVVSLLWRCAGLQCPLHCERRPSGTNEGQLQGLNRLPGFSFGGWDLGTLDRPSQRIQVISNDAQRWGEHLEGHRPGGDLEARRALPFGNGALAMIRRLPAHLPNPVMLSRKSGE
ncbi:hypothetical protein CC79DRAFT_578190 [Sarocladium strictum]